MMSVEETEARHRKELKSLEGEKRASIKKAKSTGGKGKKAKDAVAQIDAEYETKLAELKQRHLEELSELQSKDDAVITPTDVIPPETQGRNPDISISAQTLEREQKLSKAQRKREKARQKERERELEIEKAKAEAGPSLRQIELEQIQKRLNTEGFRVEEVPSDGNCLYRAVALHCGRSYQDIRNMCADVLHANEEDFAPFCEYDNGEGKDFASYVERVRHSSDWGGHLELRALNIALKRPIWVYSAQSVDPLRISMEEEEQGELEPIRLSYHLHYYALGEHYNQVVKAS